MCSIDPQADLMLREITMRQDFVDFGSHPGIGRDRIRSNDLPGVRLKARIIRKAKIVNARESSGLLQAILPAEDCRINHDSSNSVQRAPTNPLLQNTPRLPIGPFMQTQGEAT